MAKRRTKGDGSIFQRPDGRWVGQVNVSEPGAPRRRKTVYGATKAEVRRRLEEAKDQHKRGNYTTKSMTFGAWLDYWIDKVVDVRPNTKRTYERQVRLYLKPELGHIRLDRLDLAHVYRLHESMDRLAGSTVTQAHRTAGNALHDAMLHKLIVTNPFAIVRAPRYRKTKRRALTPAEYDDFLELIRHRPDASRWLTAVILGARQGECLGLTWDRVNFDTMTLDFEYQAQRIPYRHGCPDESPCGYKRAYRCPARQIDAPKSFDFTPIEGNICWVPPKTDASRRIAPIPLDLIGPLRQRWVEYQHQQMDPEFVDHGLVWADAKGSPLDDRADYWTWRELLDEGGIDPVALHAARNTAATNLLRKGNSAVVIQGIMGHSDMFTQQGYQQADITMARAAVDAGKDS